MMWSKSTATAVPLQWLIDAKTAGRLDCPDSARRRKNGWTSKRLLRRLDIQTSAQTQTLPHLVAS